MRFWGQRKLLFGAADALGVKVLGGADLGRSVVGDLVKWLYRPPSLAAVQDEFPSTHRSFVQPGAFGAGLVDRRVYGGRG
jgi:hypothetical protein